jgi:hypothetical protein
MDQQIGHIAAGTQQVAAETSQAMASVSEIAAAAQQSFPASQELAASAQETSAAAAEIAAASRQLAFAGDRLGNIAGRFELDRSGAHARVADLGQQLGAALNAHGAWKRRLADAIASGSSDADPKTVCKDDKCAFGKWLHEDFPPDGRQSPDYVTVHDLHEQFHRHAAEVLTLALANKRAEAEKAMGPGGPFAETSSKLTGALLAWNSRAGG